MKECKNAGLPEPFYFYDMSGFFVEFRKDIYTSKYLKSLDLNERLIKAVLYVKENKKITNSEYQELNNCSRNTASSDLMELVKMDFLKPSGQKGAGAFYTF
jgi:ATP-dependent DNA helicase RecG